jgi:HEAT repeat protein
VVIEPDRSKLVPVFIEMTKSPNPAVRNTAFAHIGKLGSDGKAAVPALIDVLVHGNANDWFGAIQALGDIGPAASEAVPRIERLISSRRR